MTAVQYLEEEMLKGNFSIKNVFEQAKEMEKQQIIKAYDAGLFDGTMDDVNDRMYKHYYNETFNK